MKTIADIANDAWRLAMQHQIILMIWVMSITALGCYLKSLWEREGKEGVGKFLLGKHEIQWLTRVVFFHIHGFWDVIPDCLWTDGNIRQRHVIGIAYALSTIGQGITTLLLSPLILVMHIVDTFFYKKKSVN